MQAHDVLLAPAGSSGDLDAALDAFTKDRPGRFILLLALDYESSMAEGLFTFAQSCLRRQLSFCAAVGRECEVVHDLFDEAEVILTIDEPGSMRESTLLTTWHDDESASQVLDFLVEEVMATDEQPHRLLVIADGDYSPSLEAALTARVPGFHHLAR